MKYTRSQLRHACYRAKNNAITEKEQPIVDYISAYLGDSHTWERFSNTWDILLDQEEDILIIKPEDDYDFIHSTCLEAKLLASRKLPFDDFSDRQKNIIRIIESRMLGGLMSWGDYGTTWSITLDKDLKFIDTQMLNLRKTQLEVTDEMIEKSKKIPKIAKRGDIPDDVELSTRNATPEEIERIQKQLESLGVEVPTKKKKKKAKKKKTKINRKTS